MIRISPSVYTGVTVLPSVIAEKHLIMAGEAQLKAIIYIFNSPAVPISAAEVAAGCGLKESEAADALEYWISCGVLTDAAGENAVVPAAVEKPEEKPAQKEEKKVIDAKPTRYSRDMIIARINESPEIATLFYEAQLKLGRTIGTGDQSSLLLLMDYYGLPLEIILTICEYAKTHGKSNNINYIYTIGVDWSKREIDTIERADEELKQIERATSAWKEFCALTGVKHELPTVSQTDHLRIWLNEWHFPMNVIVLAYEENVKNTGKMSFPYINKVLANWHKKGIQTPEDVAKEQTEFREKKEKKAAEKTSNSYNTDIKPKDTGSNASYDLERAANKAKTQVPTLKKREKR